jgi:endoglucanase
VSVLPPSASAAVIASETATETASASAAAAAPANANATTTAPQSPTSPATTSPPLAWRGVSLAGAEFGEGNLPGTYGVDYIYPANEGVGYYKAKGMNLVRVPFRWERLQPQLNQDFDATELGRLKSLVDAATAQDVDVLLDPHNYARYRGEIVGSAAVPHQAFADFWQRLALQFKDNPHILFGLMNEPHSMATETWVAAANAGIAAIRGTGATNVITVPGNGWTGAHSWSQNFYGTPNAQAMLNVTDSGNKLVFEVHQYLDADSSGTSATCVSPTIGVERLRDFTGWLKANGKRGLLGEFAGGDNDTCRQAVSATLQYMKDNGDQWAGWVWWAGGPWWGDYFYTIEPKAGTDRPQMQWLSPYLN